MLMMKSPMIYFNGPIDGIIVGLLVDIIAVGGVDAYRIIDGKEINDEYFTDK